MFGNVFSDDFDNDAGIDLTPLIDAVFMLIIFFVMTAGVVKSAIKIDLPSAGNGERLASDVRSLVIAVDKDGRIRSGDREIMAKDIGVLIDSMPDHEINLQVDKKAPFEIFVGVMDEVKGKGRTDIKISTLEPKGEKPERQ